jgi:hypothetical protein
MINDIKHRKIWHRQRASGLHGVPVGDPEFENNRPGYAKIYYALDYV